MKMRDRSTARQRYLRSCAAFAVLLIAQVVHAEWHGDQRSIMGTAISVELWSEDAIAARAAIDAVMQEMVRIDQAMSPWIETSELALINRTIPRSAPVYSISVSRRSATCTTIANTWNPAKRRSRPISMQSTIDPSGSMPKPAPCSS
jgi:thiamine biosynthesis lipoprotein ApbE